MDEHTSQHDGDVVKGFSDAALCTVVLALLLVVLVVISSMQAGDVQNNSSRFSGGMVRPSLYLECTVPGFGHTTSDELALQRTLYAGLPYVAVHLFDPPSALATADGPGSATVAGEEQPLARQQDLSLYQFMLLAPGIDPGTFSAGSQPMALLIPSIMDRQMIYEPQSASGYRVDPDQALTEQLMAALWPIYANPVSPSRRPEDFSHARTRIYVETMTVAGAGGDEHYVVIGHLSYKFPEALNDGSLAWLAGFSSGLTEIVYLGETWSDPANRTNKRIEFLRNNGFAACANAYADYAFPDKPTSAALTMREKLMKAGYSSVDIDRQAYEAAVQVRLSEALLEGRLDSYSSTLYPPFLAYPAAWAAYIAYFEKEQPEPPGWFRLLFLNRMGFD